MSTPVDVDRGELELRVSDVAYEVACFEWADLAKRLPTGRTYTRPEAEGSYMAVMWDADWLKRPGDAILILIQGYLDEGHQAPI